MEKQMGIGEFAEETKKTISGILPGFKPRPLLYGMGWHGSDNGCCVRSQ